MSVAADKQLFHDLVTTANALFVSDADFVTINGITKPTLKKIYAEFLASIGTYPTVADGLTKTNGTGTDNRFFTVPSTGDKAETRYRNDAGVAVEINSILSFVADGLTINRGKGYPLRQKTRAGVTSAQSTSWNKLILDVVVVNARQGEYYRLSYQGNESGVNGFNWIIEKYDSATYATTAAGRIELIPLTGTQPQIIRAGGIQTVVLVPTSRPEMQFKITVDPAGLPAAGTPINSNSNSGFDAWSWIIDESCYTYASEYKSPQVDTLSVNAGKIFPLNATLPRGGVINGDYQAFRDLFVDLEIFGAEAGKLYRVSYVVASEVVPDHPGTPVDPNKASLGFRIEEFERSVYEASGNATTIHEYVINVGVVSRTGGFQTLTFECSKKSAVVVKITLDGAKIPANGAFFASVNPNFPARNWIIDESRYKRAPAATPSGEIVKTGVYFTWDPFVKKLTYAYNSKNNAYRVTLKPAAINQLPDINTVEIAAKVADLSKAVWGPITGATEIVTDYLPPMQIEAVNNGDGHAQMYTGGAHGNDGNTAGSPTARNASFTLFADGQIIESPSSGFANVLQGMIWNELMAYNTTTEGRYVADQVFSLDFSGSGARVHADIIAKEDIIVRTDNGPQHYFGGFDVSQMMPESQTPARIAKDTTVSSGARTSYPRAWILLTKSTYGTMASWMDRSYGVGNGEYVHPTAPFIRGPGPDRAKFYHAAVASIAVPLAPGGSYRWRGGFHFFSDTAFAEFDSRLSIKMPTEKVVAVKTSGASLVS
ncbi:hypothetical protein PPUJ20028_32920 [Pseudomonas putida]|uniref:Uncharacterized protein n=1 Tax=Pseudomonas putida TaxID=303 RepID=A0AA37VVK7_PSEPU|nr:hypothetical protein [Pseudomonas putida]GLO14709.1 hypothetical protein PPUJ20028_32920 [Pseudomonas putida]GLO34924.1 hypothetical protein PPUN14671_17570 [Pseudomonas putida]HDS0963592.1 hypothetical protein [Pseudomonas putida]HDS0988851.1 hypothetical protein [Pseudomonas putida]